MNRFVGLAFIIAGFWLSSSAAFGQGSLTPPGPPAPTFKTLQQVEPRTPISAVPFTISQSGAYYLTQSVTASNSGGAISIAASDVDLDLNGFTITSTGSATIGVQVALQGGATNVRIHSGTITGGNGGVSVAPGCLFVTMEDLVLRSCTGFGVLIGVANNPTPAVGCVIRRCRAFNNGTGFSLAGSSSNTPEQHIVEDCIAINNTARGFFVSAAGCFIARNQASGNSVNNYEIAAGNRLGAIITPTSTSTVATTSGGGSGTSDPYANIRY